MLHNANQENRMFRSCRSISMMPMLVFVCMAISCEEAEDTRGMTYLKASNTDRADAFGVGLAWSQDDLVDELAVGASFEDSAATGADGDQQDDSAPDSGAVYLFRRSDSVDAEWAQAAYVKASNAGADDRFGYSVSLVGDRMAVGAFGEASAAKGVNGDQSDDAAYGSGAVYVFRRVDGGWQQEAYIKASNTAAGDQFGYSVSLWGDTLVVGAPREDGRSAGVGGDDTDCCVADSGAVYVFRRMGEEWQQEAYIKSSNTDLGHHFGQAVSLSLDTLAVGAPNFDRAVYMFRRLGSSWQEEARLQGSVTGVADGFGFSVSLWGDDALAVGAPYGDGGAAYVFYRAVTGWREDARLAASNENNYDYFGWSVALSGRFIAVGAMGEMSAARGVNGDQEDNSIFEAGAAYVFLREDMMWKQQAYLKASNTGIGDYFGSAVALRPGAAALWEGEVAVSSRGEASAATGINGKQSDNAAGDSGAVYVFDEL
jgi:trimeric autotransporter adhesin